MYLLLYTLGVVVNCYHGKCLKKKKIQRDKCLVHSKSRALPSIFPRFATPGRNNEKDNNKIIVHDKI